LRGRAHGFDAAIATAVFGGVAGGLNHFVFFGERHLRYVVKEFMAHYHAERFHQWNLHLLIIG
jgi:hypothetical protein